MTWSLYFLSAAAESRKNDAINIKSNDDEQGFQSDVDGKEEHFKNGLSDHSSDEIPASLTTQ